MNFAMLLFHAVMEVTSLTVHVEREIKVEWLLNFVHLNAKMEDADQMQLLAAEEMAVVIIPMN